MFPLTSAPLIRWNGKGYSPFNMELPSYNKKRNFFQNPAQYPLFGGFLSYFLPSAGHTRFDWPTKGRQKM
jgi:hypothetical protein